MSSNLLILPIETLGTIAFGVLAYLVGHFDNRCKQNNWDILLIVIVYSFIGRSILELQALGGWWVYLAWVGAVVVPSVLAILWHRWLYAGAISALRSLRLSRGNYNRNFWDTLNANLSTHSFTELIVTTTDGTQLKSSDMGKFTNMPFGIADLGADGSVALYVTHMRDGKGDWIAQTLPSGNWPAPTITYIPAERIQTIALDPFKLT